MNAREMLEAISLAMAFEGRIEDLIAQGEEDKGNRAIRAGEAPWFPLTDWAEGSVLSVSGGELRIVLIVAQEPGTGAFTRLIAGAVAAGLRPVVIAPTAEFAATLTRRGWIEIVVGSDLMTRERRFYPPRIGDKK